MGSLQFLVLGILLAAVLLIPTMNNADALTEDECLTLANHKNSDGTLRYEAYYTALTCETNGFDITLYPGQAMMIQNPNGGGAGNGAPFKNIPGHGETGSTGTFQYSDGTNSGTVRIVDTPNTGVVINNIEASFSGSQMTVSGTIVNNNNFVVKDVWAMLYVTDDAGNEKGTWVRVGNEGLYSGIIPAVDGVSFSQTLCCGGSGMTTVAPYLLQVFREDGTPMIDVDVNPGSAQVTQLTIDSFEVFEEGTQTRYSVSGAAPASTDMTFKTTKPDGTPGNYPGGAGTGNPSYSMGGLIDSTDNLVYGNWILEVCAPEYDMCVQESFTINSPPVSTFITTLTEDNGSTCIGYENTPAGTGSVWLLGPQTGNSAYYYENSQWHGGANVGGGTTCSDGFASGEYKFAAFSNALGSNDPNVGNLIEFATPINIAASASDTTPPIITVPNDITITTSDIIEFTTSSGTQSGAIAWDGGGVSFGDSSEIPSPACTGNFSPQGYLNGPVSFPVGTTTVTCSAPDAAGNIGTASFTVTVNYVPPQTDSFVTVLSYPMESCIGFENAPSGTTTVQLLNSDYVPSGDWPGSGGFSILDVNYLPSYSPSFLEELGITSGQCINRSGSGGNSSSNSHPAGEYKVAAYDSSGNLITHSTPIVLDAWVNTGPIFTVPNNIIQTTTDTSGTTVSFTVTGTSIGPPIEIYDSNPNCGAEGVDISVAGTGSSMVRTLEASSHFPVGTTTVSCSVYSIGGIGAFETFDVTVVLGETPVGDATPPVIDMSSVMTHDYIGVDQYTGTIETGFTDVTDSNGGQGEGPSFIITVPTVTDDVLLGSNPTCSLTKDDGTAVSGREFNNISTLQEFRFWGTTTLTCSATDAAGNTGTGSFNITHTFAPTVQMSMSSGGFSPSTVDVISGQYIRMCEYASETHQIVSGNPTRGPSGHFDSGLLVGSKCFSHEFTESGTYEYYDTMNPNSTGTIIVDGNDTLLTGTSIPGAELQAIPQEAQTVSCSSECNLSDRLGIPTPYGQNFMQPAIAMSGNDITVVWQINIGVPDPIYFTKSHDGGMTFGERVHIGDFPTGHHPDELWSRFNDSGNNTEGLAFINYSYPSMGNSNNITLQSGGNSYKVWSVNICNPDGISANICYPDNNEVFLSKNNSTPINLSNNTTGSVGAVVAVDGSNVYVGWKDYSSGDTKAYVARSTNGGVSFESPLLVDSKANNFMGGNSMNISIVASDGNVYAAWLNNGIIFDKLNFDSTSDMVAPIVTVPSTIHLWGDAGTSQIVTFDVSATDNVGVVGDVTCNVESGSAITLQNGSSRTVTCSATDAEGNVGYGTFGIYTDDRFDFTLPSECADDFRQWSGGNEIPMTAIVSGSDVTSSITMDWAGLGDVTSKFVYQKNGQTVKVVDVPAPTSNSPTFVDVSSLSQGEYTVFACLWNNHTGTMSGGDGGTWDNEPVTRFAESQTFNVISEDAVPSEDAVKPVVIVPDNISIQTISNDEYTVTFSISATDDVDGNIIPICSSNSGSSFPIGLTTVTCTATDSMGNVGIGTFTVTIINTTATGDVTSPSFTSKQNIILEATTSNGATVIYDLPQVTDNSGVVSIPNCVPTSGSFFPIGPTIVTCTATDAAGNQGSTTFTVTVQSPIAAPVEVLTDVSVSVGKPNYSSTEAIFVTGIATPLTDNEISLSVIDSSGNLVFVESIFAETSETYSGIIFPNSLWSESGTYSITATYGDSVDTVPFEFEFISTITDNSNIPTGITLHLDSAQRILGDKLNIISTLTDGSSGQSIIIRVIDPAGNSVRLQSLNTDEIGSVELSLDIQNNWIPGEYSITASDTSPLWDYTTSESLSIVAPLPEITISPTVTTTESGNAITSYNAGDIGYFSTSLLSEATSGVLVTVNVVDSQDTTLGVAFFKSVIGKGDSDVVLGFKIPEDAADGEARIYVNTYTDWIDQGGIPISSELISTVHINGVVTEIISESIDDDSFDVVIIPANGSYGVGCEETTEGCFLPLTATVNLGDVILFSNTDSAPHTFTAGNPSDGPTGEFDTNVLMAGESYEWTADVAGEIDYFCMIHPWMTGVITVQGDEIIIPVSPENIIPSLSFASNVMLSASSDSGSIVNYTSPTATGGVITTGVSCTPPSGNMFPIGSTQVTCTATNQIGNTGMTSFMVTVNPIIQTITQTVTVIVGKDTYTSVEPLFVTGSVGTVTGDPINLEVRDNSNKLVGIEQVNPKESGSYSAVLTSNELWSTNGVYSMIANYGSITSIDSFEFEIIAVESVITESIPTALSISTENSAYLLGESILIDLELVGTTSGESILLEIRDSANTQVLLQSLNTDKEGKSDITYQLQSTQDSGLYSIIATSTSESWSFSETATFTAIAPIPDVTIGDVIPTIEGGTVVESLKTGDMVSFNTPVISNSISDVLITVNIFDAEDTPLGLAYFKSKIVNDEFDIILGLQIPQDAAPGMATVYINTYTDWTENGGVAINEEQISFIEISSSSNVVDLEVSSDDSGENVTTTPSDSTSDDFSENVTVIASNSTTIGNQP